jgi:hypothetical protein
MTSPCASLLIVRASDFDVSARFYATKGRRHLAIASSHASSISSGRSVPPSSSLRHALHATQELTAKEQSGLSRVSHDSASMASSLRNFGAFDPATFAAAVVLGATPPLACHLPAVRAARVSPLEAFRAE